MILLKKSVQKYSLVLLSLAIALASCGEKKAQTQEQAEPSGEQQTHSGPITLITSVEQFNTVTDQSGDKLLVFDLYADWCMPCRMLSPILEKIAERNQSKAAFYKINVSRLPQITQTFGVRGIPHVAFMKNRTVVDALVGLQPEERYEKAIAENAGK